MKPITALAGGLAGALALTLIHESTRRVVDNAPRMDKLGMETLKKGYKAVDKPAPSRKKLFYQTMVADIVGNALYYSLAGAGKRKNVLLKSVGLGLASGIGAVLLPKPMGLDPKPSNKSTKTKLLTMALYLAGSLITSGSLLATAPKSK